MLNKSLYLIKARVVAMISRFHALILMMVIVLEH